MAEAVMNNMINESTEHSAEEFIVESAATSREEIGNDIYPPAKRCMDAHGIPYRFRAAHQMTSADYDRFDYIICMDENNMRNLKRIIASDPEHKISKMLDWADPGYIEGRSGDVADPWYTGNFEQTYQDIFTGCKALLEKIG